MVAGTDVRSEMPRSPSLARDPPTTQSAIARLERGGNVPSWDHVRRIVEACGLELSVNLVEPRSELGDDGAERGDGVRRRARRADDDVLHTDRTQ
jgi:transcriptional regulator with XRE-family HTH domain